MSDIIGEERDRERQNAQLLAMLEEGNSKIAIPGFDRKRIWDFTKQQIKDNWVKPKRMSGRIADPLEEKYVAPVGIFNLGNNSLFYKPDVKKYDDEEGKDLSPVTVVDEEGNETVNTGKEEEVEIHNNVKTVDGKLYFVEEEQGEIDAEEEKYKFNIAVKNDIPYQIYKKILHFGRLTTEELFGMYKAIAPEMMYIIIHDMLNKGFLKPVKEFDQEVEFDDEATNPKDFVKITEKEIETLEVTTVDERRMVLEDKKDEQVIKEENAR